jgi:hypothetical protein
MRYSSLGVSDYVGSCRSVSAYHDEGFVVGSLRFVERRATTAFIMISGC